MVFSDCEVDIVEMSCPDGAVLPQINFKIKYDLSQNKVSFISKYSINKL